LPNFGRDSKPSAPQAVPTTLSAKVETAIEHVIDEAQRAKSRCNHKVPCEGPDVDYDDDVSAPQAESVKKEQKCQIGTNVNTSGKMTSTAKAVMNATASSVDAPEHANQTKQSIGPLRESVPAGKDAARNERIAELSRKVWKDCGWGDGDTECSEGRLCDAAVRAGYEAGQAFAASETAALRAERDSERNLFATIKSNWRKATVLLCDLNDQWVKKIAELGREITELREASITVMPCGHYKNFLMGDEYGNFTCQVCRAERAELDDESK
jgi:hypothetical protein